jgi:hypothetical protein
MATYSKTRWCWEVFQQLMIQFGDLIPFLEENSDVAPASRHVRSISVSLGDSQKSTKLQLELAAVIDSGETVVKATYKLEGDEALMFTCFDVLSSLELDIRTAHYPNLVAVAKKLGGAAGTTLTQQPIQYEKPYVRPGLEYYMKK